MKNLQGWMILGIACLAGCVGTTIPVQAQQTATAIVVKERLVEHVGDRLIIDMKLALDELSLSARRYLAKTSDSAERTLAEAAIAMLENRLDEAEALLGKLSGDPSVASQVEENLRQIAEKRQE